MSKKIISIEDMKFREELGDPFVTRMYHIDYYPKGNKNMGIPKSNLKDKNIGDDFDHTSKWKLYNGRAIPGYPVHPHRGFEAITIVLQGFVDHFNSTGVKGRYGPGDVQWMTAGSGIQHSELFPLINEEENNILELFQVWLNLPPKDKFVDPFYKMLWAEDIPQVIEEDKKGNKAKINIIAGSHKNTKALEPNPNSWAKEESHNMGIWRISLEPGARITLPQISNTLNRTLHYYRGENISIDSFNIKGKSSIKLSGNQEIEIFNGEIESHLLLLEGEPINEPMVNYGPFVMNTMNEIKEAHIDFNATKFGGWPWDMEDPVNPKDIGRFVKYSNGQIEKP